MAYTMGRDPDRPIIHSWVSKDFNLNNEFEAFLTELKSLFDGMEEPTVYIPDLRDYAVNFGDMTRGLSLLTRGDLGVLRHPRLHKTIVVTENALMKLGTGALGQNQYGSLRATVVKTMEEGMEEALKELALIEGQQG